MLEVFDKTLKKLAVLENAFGASLEETLNGVGHLTFSLPNNDVKAMHCKPFYFVRPDGGDYFRILSDAEENADTGALKYTCEHGIATLVDDVMFQTHMIGGESIETRTVLEYILNRQTVRHWRLGDCEFTKQFEYGYESENLLNGMLAVPNLFVEPYIWAYDMRTYPWTVHLRALDAGGKPGFYIHAGKNLLKANAKRSMDTLCTRLYLLGYGEGDNQLTITDINGGLPYLQSPRSYIDRYGLISKVYVDRQFEDAESLMERGKALLAALQEPRYTRTFDVVDLYEITHADYDTARVGDLVRMELDDENVFVTKTVRSLDADKPGDLKIEMSTTPTDIAASIADIADRQRIEQVYAQGATQIYAQSVQANATTTTPAVLNFFIPREMRIINKVEAKIRLESFRSYSRATNGGGGTTSTSSSGGGSATTSDQGGGSSVTSDSSSKTTVLISNTWTKGQDINFTLNEENPVFTNTQSNSTTSATTGSTSTVYASTGSAGSGSTGSSSPGTGGSSNVSTQSASGPGSHYHSMGHTHYVNSHSHSLGSHSHSMNHGHTVNSHSHTLSHYHYLANHRHQMAHQHYIDHYHNIDHTHTVKVPAHNHGVTIPAHTHTVDIPNHTHQIEQGIFRFGSPRCAKIQINGADKLTMGEDREIDLTEYLLNDSGKIPRGSWIRLGVLPDDLAYITIDVIVQGFVQSRGGGTH